MMGSLSVSLRISSRIDKQGTVHPNDLSFQKEWRSENLKNGILVE